MDAKRGQRVLLSVYRRYCAGWENTVNRRAKTGKLTDQSVKKFFLEQKDRLRIQHHEKPHEWRRFATLARSVHKAVWLRIDGIFRVELNKSEGVVKRKIFFSCL